MNCAWIRCVQRYQLDHPFLLYVGNIKPHKNLERLIDAFGRARAAGLADFRLMIIGDEISKYPPLRQAVHRHRLDKYVRFLGFQPYDTLAAFYRLARVFVFPSLYEGFGLPPLEAMACGTPVVTSNVSSLPEIAGGAAILVDPHDPESIAEGIVTAAADDSYRARAHPARTGTRARFLVDAVRGGDPSHLHGSARAVKIALIHDWLTGMRGGERALLAFCEMFPDADLFTLVQVPGATDPIIERRRVRTSPIQRLPFAGRLYRHYLPLFPIAIEQFDLDGYDLVLSTSHCAAKSVVVAGHTRHLCYCLTPMRYAWDQFDAYFGPERVGERCSRVMRPVMAAMARWDRATEGRVHRYLAISQYVARRIALYYNRQSSIVYPPVETTFYTPEPGPRRTRQGLLVVSALVPYKRVDLAIRRRPARRGPVDHRRRRPGTRSGCRTSPATASRFWAGAPTKRFATCIAARSRRFCPAKKISASCRSKRRPADVRSSRWAAAARCETVVDGWTGVLVEPGVEALADGLLHALATRLGRGTDSPARRTLQP